MAKVVTILSNRLGVHAYFDVSDAVAAAINMGQEDIEFETLDGFTIGLNRANFVYIAVGDGAYLSSPPKVEP